MDAAALAGWAGALPGVGDAARRGRAGRRGDPSPRFLAGSGHPAPRPPRRAVVAADLDRLAAGQRADGGWEVDFTAYSPAAALEWRAGYATVEAVGVLRAHGRA